MQESPELPWLREMVPEALEGLFQENDAEIPRTVQRLVEHMDYDRNLETQLIETLQTAVEQHNDDTQGAIWIALILGEKQCHPAIPLLLTALGEEEDEELQAAAGIALLKMGSQGVESLIESLEEESPSVGLLQAGCRLLGHVGYLDDPDLRQRAMDFLLERLEAEKRRPGADLLIENIASALAELGDRRAIPALQAIFQERFQENNVALQDALEMLEENLNGQARTGDFIPGEEDYRWAFEAEPESQAKKKAGAKKSRRRRKGLTKDMKRFYRGLGTEFEP
ncbi:MAG: hypothetical protein HY717_01130 [Planctomycetes bacterium]|nr:hypothetical protein [Planctomycetota bacterium]